MKLNNSIIDIVKKLYPFDYSVAGEGNDRAIKTFKNYLNFKIYNFKTNKNLNGWIIPRASKILKGEIYENKKKILDYKNSSFHVISQSNSFKGVVDGKNLIKRLIFSNKLPGGLPYGWTGLYRPNQSEWGFSVKKSFVKKIKPNKKYKVNIISEFKKNTMKVLDYKIKGKSNKTFIFNAHNCHKFQANDDISGCAVGIKLFEHLKKKKLKYSYRLVIAPELFGPMFWLKQLGSEIKNFKGAILLKAVGNQNKLKLQNSFNLNTFLDKSAELAILKQKQKFKKGNFRTVYGNDETVFEAPGYKIPTITLTRYPFKEYHTNLDTPKILKEKNLQETLDVCKSIVEIIEKNENLVNNHKGLVCLSNKKYNLYKPAYSPGVDKIKYTDDKRRWNLLMNCLPMEIENGSNILNLSYKYKIDFFDLSKYLDKWVKKKLIKYSKETY